MTYRVILTLVSGGNSDRECLAAGAALAREFQAEARVLAAAPDAAETMIGYDLFAAGQFSTVVQQELRDARTRLLDSMAANARAAAAAADIAFGRPARPQAHVTVANPAATPWLTLMAEAPFGDLAVISHQAARDRRALASPFADLLMDLRLPVLMANGTRPLTGGSVAVAWNGSMEAGRAIRAAMPLLTQAKQVLLVQNKGGVGWMQKDAAALERCTDYLHSHGVRRLESLVLQPEADHLALIEAAKDAGADLMVAGAYGHPRWQESLFDGFTRTLFSDADAPHLLVSH